MKRSETFVEAFTKILIQQNSIKQDAAKAFKKVFFDRSQATFEDFLIEKGLVSRTKVLNALSQYYNVPAFDVVGQFFDHNVLLKFPKGFLLRNEIIPFEQDENIMFIISSNPNNPELLAKIGRHVSYDIQFMVGLTRDITDAVKEFYDLSLSEVSKDVDLREERQREKEAEELLNDDEK